MDMVKSPGRTYKYLQIDVCYNPLQLPAYNVSCLQPIYPFGHGLSYTTFKHEPVSPLAHTSISTATTTDLNFRIKVTNTGSRAGDEVVLAFTTHTNVTEAPLKKLFGFKRIYLKPDESQEVFFASPPETLLSIVDASGNKAVHPGAVRVMIGDATFFIDVYGQSRGLH